MYLTPREVVKKRKSGAPPPNYWIRFFRIRTCAFVILMSSAREFWSKPSKFTNWEPKHYTTTGGAIHLFGNANNSSWRYAVPGLGRQIWPYDKHPPLKTHGNGLDLCQWQRKGHELLLSTCCALELCTYIIFLIYFFIWMESAQYKINHFNVYNSVAFSMFTVLCNHHLSLFPHMCYPI